MFCTVKACTMVPYLRYHDDQLSWFGDKCKTGFHRMIPVVENILDKSTPSYHV